MFYIPFRQHFTSQPDEASKNEQPKTKEYENCAIQASKLIRRRVEWPATDSVVRLNWAKHPKHSKNSQSGMVQIAQVAKMSWESLVLKIIQKPT